MMGVNKTLFAMVEDRDPFAPSLVDGVEQAGTILSMMAMRPYDLLFLFYTPTTQTNAQATLREVGLRYPECKVVLLELPDSDPQDPFALFRQLSRRVGQATRMSRGSQNHVCMSSGTPEMRAALFFLVTAGVLPASLLHVGSPAERLFDAPDVKEVRLDTSDAISLPEASRDVEIQMELLEAGLPHASTDRYPELEGALKELQIYIYSAAMRSAAETAARVAPTNAPVLILGPTGTGKELFAKLVRRLSDRRNKAFVVVNCAAISETLSESEMFGHVKGAFTDAKTDREGKFEAADKGTLFLDEIGDLTPQTQAKLLRALEQGEIQRLGSSSVRKVDVRIVAATNVNLKEAMAKGTFRTDLYYRLSGVEVSLPPLQARREEIASLAVRLLERLNQEGEPRKILSKDSIFRLMQHSWPGNVRELRGVLKNAKTLAEGDVIEPKDLKIDTTPPGKEYLDLLPGPAPGFSLKKLLDTVREHQMRKALLMCNENQSQAAKLLGISKQAVSEFLSKPDDSVA